MSDGRNVVDFLRFSMKRRTPDEGAYEAAVKKAFRTAIRQERHVRQERARIPQALEVLRKEGALGLLAKPRLFGSLAGYWALLERSHELRYDDPEQMVDLARLALVVAEKLNPEHHEATILADLCCRATIELANAYRVADQLDKARATLGEAAQWLHKGTGNSHLEVRLYDVQASLLGASRHFEAACEALDVVYKTHFQSGDTHLAGRALIKKGLYANYKGDAEGAIPILRQGLSLIDGEGEPGLLFAGVHNLARCYMDLGQFRKARALLWANRRRYKEALGRVNDLKLLWLEAQIDLGLDQRERAKERFCTVKAGFWEAGLSYKEALVTLELALVYAQEGRVADARTLGMDAAEVFLSLGIERETLSAVLLLRRAFELRVLPVALLQSVLEFLREAEKGSGVSLREWLKI